MVLKVAHPAEAHVITSCSKENLILPARSSINKENVLPIIIWHLRLTTHFSFLHTDESTFSLLRQQDTILFFCY